MSQLFARALFALAVIFLFFVLGAATEYFWFLRIPPLHNALTSVDRLKDVWGPPGFLIKPRYQETGVTVYDRERTHAGINLVTGIWQKEGRWTPEIRLMDMDGNKLHEWSAVFADLWPESPYEEVIINPKEYYVHGVSLLRNGDVVFNIDYMGLFRLDMCGNVVWKIPYRTHHSVFRDDRGDFWVAGLRKRNEADPRFFGVRPYFGEDSVMRVSADGEILENISILESIYSSNYYEIFAGHRKSGDFTHLNDVETLSDDLAADFPMFDAGDIMVSLRNISTVLILDGKSHKVKWHYQFPLLRQHDPDFEPGGRITIYNNRDDSTSAGKYLGQSQIISVDPSSGNYRKLYPVSEETQFYSNVSGKHSLLPNGNRLMVEPRGGRALEITPDGDLVWNWVVEKQPDGTQSEILEVTRFPVDYIDLEQMQKCSDS